MTRLNLVPFAVCFPAILSLAGCSSQPAAPAASCNAGDPSCAGVGGSGATGGSTQGPAVGGAPGSGGATMAAGGVPSATGGSRAQASTGNSGGSSTNATGGTSATGGAAGGKVSTGGTSPTATGGAAGGKVSTGGTSPTATGGAAGGKVSTGGTNTTGVTGGTNTAGVTGGTNTTGVTGGMGTTGGSVTATGGSNTDAGGKPLAKSGDKTSTANDYLNLGNVRLINNNWGSVSIANCSAPMSVTATDTSLSWTFNRGNCGDDGSKPDYPEVEFGVAPFGKTSSLRTTPPFSTTTLLPIQVKNIQSASVSIGNFAINLQNNTNWNINIEFWLSKLDPLANDDAQAYAEIMGLWGMSAGAQLWKCNVTGQSVSSGGKSYNLCHQSDTWGTGGTWRFFQFQASSLSQSFSGTVDVKAFLDWFYNSSYGSGVSKDYYLTRIEIGSEIDDSTSGSCTLSNVSYTINGTTQSPVLAK